MHEPTCEWSCPAYVDLESVYCVCQKASLETNYMHTHVRPMRSQSAYQVICCRSYSTAPSAYGMMGLTVHKFKLKIPGARTSPPTRAATCYSLLNRRIE